MTAKSPRKFPGIYTITCVPTGRVYVGKAEEIQRRWTRHRRDIRMGEHHNPYLVRAWKKYGEDAFIFDVAADLSSVPQDQLVDALADAEREVLALHPKTFNMTVAGPGGMKPKPELSARLSAQRTARWADPEFRERVIASMKRAAADPEFQKLRGEAIARAKTSPAYKIKRSRIMKEMWASDGFREARIAERSANWKDPHYRANQNASRVAVWADDEKRERRVAGLKASWADPEARARRQAAMRAGRSKRSPVEDACLAFLREAAPSGYTAVQVWRAVEARMGVEVARASPRIALMRIVNAGVAVRDGKLYRAFLSESSPEPT